MKFKLAVLPILFSLLCFPFKAAGDSEPAKLENPAKNPELSPTPTPAHPSETSHDPGTSKMIEIHKPMPLASWGRVIQYNRKDITLPGKNRETLHEFLFQDGQGIVRTAIFHENASGDGYWEVWIWDQP